MNREENRTEDILLIEQIRENISGAFERLLKKYSPLIDASVASFSRDEVLKSHSDDLRQEAILTFYNAILNYDIENDGVDFGLYAKISIKNGLITQRRMLLKRSAEQPQSDPLELKSDEGEEPSKSIVEEESLARMDGIIRKNLSPLEYRVWCLFVAGKTASDIGRSVGKSEKSVSNAIYRIRRKLRELLG